MQAPVAHTTEATFSAGKLIESTWYLKERPQANHYAPLPTPLILIFDLEVSALINYLFVTSRFSPRLMSSTQYLKHGLLLCALHRTDLLAHHRLRPTAVMTKQDTLVAPEPTLPGLPVEVRERILFFALPSAGRKNFVVCRADPVTAANNLTASGKCLPFHKKQCPGIALVNKKISEECINLLQKTRNFGFCSAICLGSFLKSIHPDLARKIDKISCKKVISEHHCEIHQTRPLADLVTGVHTSVQLTLRPTKWRSVLTLDLMTPPHYPVATLMVQACSSADQQSSGPTEFEDVEVYDLAKRRKVSVGIFKVSIDLDKEVLEARDILLEQEFRQAVATLAGVPVAGLNVTFVALQV